MTSLDELRQERIKKADALRESGVDPYPASTTRDAALSAIHEKWGAYTKRTRPAWVAGRIMALRRQGSIIFLDIDDGTARLQAMLKKGEIAEGPFTQFADTVDIGDFVSLRGTFTLTKRKERTIMASEWKMLTKSVRPLPDKWHGLKDTEERYRKRYVDILMDDRVKERFLLRSQLVQEMRTALTKSGFQEMETPILQHLAGGATAEPFITHHNALDVDLYLRIAPELYLKELLVAGFPKVFELGRSFRNEGIDATHNPEFTTVEIYEAYTDAAAHRKQLEKLIKDLAKKVLGKQSFTYGDNTIAFNKPFKSVSFYDLLQQKALIGDPHGASAEELANKAQQIGADAEKGMPRYKLLDAIFKKVCRPKIIQPTFIVDYPAETSPLAKKNAENKNIIDRYQLVVGGLEVMNGFSELNDPIEQEKRFKEQEAHRQIGDEEAQPKDEEYLEALEYGMPPAAGAAISIDRFTMLFTDAHNIREVILFPTLRPKQKEEGEGGTEEKEE